MVVQDVLELFSNAALRHTWYTWLYRRDHYEC
jgi:hypothetical protein